MALPIEPPYPPMEALPVGEIPSGPQWQYEPKWDGFRCLAFKDGETIELQSKSGQSLTRYFPELVAGLKEHQAKRFILDGEIVIPEDGRFSFDLLLQRIHPAASRIDKLSKQTPAQLIVFDLLATPGGKSLIDATLKERRRHLERFFADNRQDQKTLQLSPVSLDAEDARSWLAMAGGGLDGVVAKRLDMSYQSGERTGMQKIKRLRSADCVVGGFRYASRGDGVGSLLLGLYDDDGLLHHVGFTSSFSQPERKSLRSKLEPLVKPPGFTGNAPGGPSRWSTKRSTEWQPLAPRLVAEVQYDHFTGDRFRHGTKFLRWRPDKSPRQCTKAQLGSAGRSSITETLKTGTRRI